MVFYRVELVLKNVQKEKNENKNQIKPSLGFPKYMCSQFLRVSECFSVFKCGFQCVFVSVRLCVHVSECVWRLCACVLSKSVSECNEP